MRRTLLLCLCLLCLPMAAVMAQPKRPNIVWLVLDDASLELGSYGDPQARTPHMDRLAREGMRFTNAFTHAPVCAPSRSGLITGMYPTTTGAHHMRSQLINPPETFTALLRRAGYYVDWPGKTDFNFAPIRASAEGGARPVDQVPEGAFDSRQDWTRKDAPLPRAPFFAYFNIGVTHESQIRAEPEKFAQLTARLKPEDRHDPAKVPVPPYYPDAPEVRQDIAHYYDLMTAADYIVGDILQRLEEQKVADHTIVILFSDHGRGMPRAKRWLYDSGIHVPLIIRWPGKLKPGSINTDLVSFVDFAPTMLKLAGGAIPARMQGQFFLDPMSATGVATNKRHYVYAARDRMDEAVDRIRAVRDQRFKYIRNFYPEIPYAQPIAYNEENPTMKAWRRLNAEGKLTGAAQLFFAPTKPKEELYDTEADPFEVNNLAADQKYQEVLGRMRKALEDWIVATKDMGAMPEEEMIRRGIVRDMLTEYKKRRMP